MIYIPECRLCGRSDIVPNCLRDLDVCSSCWIAPNRHGFNLDYPVRIGKDRNPC